MSCPYLSKETNYNASEGLAFLLNVKVNYWTKVMVGERRLLGIEDKLYERGHLETVGTSPRAQYLCW
jgi:hypothetical protein